MEGFSIAIGATLFFGVLFLIIFGFFGYLRWLKYKETVVLAEKGLLRPSAANGNGSAANKGTLRWGIVITALGMALCLGLYPFGFLMKPNPFPLNFGPWMIFGLVPTFFGLALIVTYMLTSGSQPKEITPPERTTNVEVYPVPPVDENP